MNIMPHNPAEIIIAFLYSHLRQQILLFDQITISVIAQSVDPFGRIVSESYDAIGRTTGDHPIEIVVQK